MAQVSYTCGVHGQKKPAIECELERLKIGEKFCFQEQVHEVHVKKCACVFSPITFNQLSMAHWNCHFVQNKSFSKQTSW